MRIKSLSLALMGASLIALTACSGGTDTKTEAPAAKKEAVKTSVTLADVIAHPRRADDTARDKFRNPKETLEFLKSAPVRPSLKFGPAGIPML